MILELRSKGYRVQLAKNDVSAGIQTVSNLLNNGEFCIHSSCAHTIREMHSYRWNEEHAKKTGIEKPIKVDDHLPDALRYCLYTKFGALGYTRLAKRYLSPETPKPTSEIASYLYNWRRETHDSLNTDASICDPYTPML